MVSSSTIFKTTEHEYILRKTHENMTPDICKAPLGFHALSGYEQTGEFPNYSKTSCLDVFVTVTNEVWQLLINLGSTDTPSVANVKSLEFFVIQLYCRHKILPNIQD